MCLLIIFDDLKGHMEALSVRAFVWGVQTRVLMDDVPLVPQGRRDGVGHKVLAVTD